MKQESFDFINTYHNRHDIDAIKRTGRREHATSFIDNDSTLAGVQADDDVIARRNDIDAEEFSLWREQVKTKAVNVSLDEFNTMRSDDIIVPAESMLENRFNKFSRYGYLDPTNELITGSREYIFFSKPDLHLVNPNSPSLMNSELGGIPFMKEAFSRYKLSYYSLQQTFKNKIEFIDNIGFDYNNKFINLLSNMVTSSFDLPDISATEVSNNQNLYQTNTSYREGSIASDLQYDFTLEFKDTKYFDVYMLFKIYDEYFRAKYLFDVTPVTFQYIYNKIYPEALSIWKIIVDDTGRIMYWAKATGCVPMSVPRGSISNIEGNIKFTINWKAQFIRDMDPVNLQELNYLTYRSLGYTTKVIDGNFANAIALASRDVRIDKDYYIVDGYRKNGPTWVGYPLIISGTEGLNFNKTLRTGHNGINNNNGFHRLIWIS